MKKYLSILLLILFIIPSVALASWWNPFSWFNGWTFHKTEVAPPVQVETQKTPEEKINELQAQLDELKKEKSDSTTTKTPVVNNKQNAPKTNPTSTENLNEIPLSMLVFNFNSIYNTIDYLENVISDFNTIIENTTEIKNFIKNNNNIYNDKDFNATIIYEESAIKAYEGMVTTLKSYLEAEKNSLSKLQAVKNTIENKNYANREDAMKDVDQISLAFDNQSKFSDSVSKYVIGIRQVYEDYESGLKMGLEIIKNKNEANKPSSNFYIPPSYYQSAPIPQIQIPKTTYCTMGSMAGTLSHYTITCN